MPSSKKKSPIWTITCEYFATGEGLTYMALITYAKNKKDAQRLFGEKFDPYYVIGCEAENGLVRNGIVKRLFSKKVLDHAERSISKAHLVLSANYHFNFS